MSDNITASAFANSWNNLPTGSVYTFDQFEDWMSPLHFKDFENKRILELGCGNGSLLVHLTQYTPKEIVGVDLGSSVRSAEKNLQLTGYKEFKILKDDITTFSFEDPFDVVYSIGVLHHMKSPLDGLRSALRNTKNGGKFHCWVYAKEGNALVRYLVEPIRFIASKLPWFINKFLIATPLAFIYYFYAHIIVKARLSFMPLYEYSKWICKREFLFFRHVAFDQLVTPQTAFLSKQDVQKMLDAIPEIDKDSTYIIFRNGNSWKFGGKKMN